MREIEALTAQSMGESFPLEVYRDRQEIMLFGNWGGEEEP
jgi:hypothetical protein